MKIIRTNKFFLATLLGLFCFVLLYDKQDSTFFSPQNLKDIADSRIPIRSINPNDTDYNDIAFLKDILAEKRIVVLGEPIHTDGSVFQAKTRMIKFLHEQMGYNVLVWESGLYDIWYMNQHPLPNNTMDYSMGVFPLWSSVEETKPLWHYLNKQRSTNHPISLCGIDLQLSGSIADSLRVAALRNYLLSRNIPLKSYPVLSDVLQDMQYNFRYSQYRLRPQQQDSLVDEMFQITKHLRTQRNWHFTDSIYIHYIEGLALWIQTTNKYPLGNFIRFGIRDSVMGENFINFVEQYYPEEKIILWCANMHLLYNHKAYSPKNMDIADLRFVSLGEHLKKRYKESCYTIAFTWFCQQANKNTVKDCASAKSLEYALHQQSIPYAFIDFNSLSETNYLRKTFVSKANQGYDISGVWSEMTDALFFIDTSKRSTVIKQ
jgi:erythromycin esterase-like protein